MIARTPHTGVCGLEDDNRELNIICQYPTTSGGGHVRVEERNKGA